jgi:hypothetical protein
MECFIFELLVNNHINFDCVIQLFYYFFHINVFFRQKCVCLPRFLFVGSTILAALRLKDKFFFSHLYLHNQIQLFWSCL